MANLPLPGPLWLIGCGNMAGAMLRRWLAVGMDPARVSVVRPSGAPVAEGVRVLTMLPEDEVPALVLLGVKPQMLDEVAPLLAPAVEPETILISLLAGTEVASLRQRFPTPRSIVRAMPNTPVVLGKGAIGLFAQGDEARPLVEPLMTPLGRVEWIEDESLFDLVTALAGAGPAFVYRFIDALTEAGVAFGLPPDQSRRLVLATVEGAAALAAAGEESARQLADRVASPGGATRKGLDVLDREDRLAALVREAIDAATRRGRELAAQARDSEGPSS